MTLLLLELDNVFYSDNSLCCTFIEMADKMKKELNLYEGSILDMCYQVEGFLGEGSFGYVTKCRHTQTNQEVAIKVNKNDPAIVEQARQEINILKELQRLDPHTCNMVRYNGVFLHQDSICINLELLDQSLLEYMEDRSFQPLTVREVTPILHQTITALFHLQTLGVVHADLKPENIMVVNRHQQPLKVKLIDFGISFKSAEDPSAFVQTQWYRAPEVMLGAPFDEAIDMWSLGLTAAELVLGSPLYVGSNDREQLNMIVETQGQPPDHVLDRGELTQRYFDKKLNGLQKWQFKVPEEFEDNRTYVFPSLDYIEQTMEMEMGPQRGQSVLVHLLKSMLHLDPEVRMQPQWALWHPLFFPASMEMTTAWEGSATGLPAKSRVDSWFQRMCRRCNQLIRMEERTNSTCAAT